MKIVTLAFVLVAPLAALAACASRGSGTARSAAAPSPAAPKPERAAPVVQVREFPSSATVSVVGWSPEEAGYGLRAEIRRDGTLVGENGPTQHRLYVSRAYVDGMGGFVTAVIPPVPPGPVLPSAAMPPDDRACDASMTCSPRATIAVQLPDGVLRASRDSVVVMFTALPGRNDWTITLPHDLITAYLRSVDSVRTSLAKR